MATISLRTRDGELHHFEGRIGMSLMENIRNAGFDELLAMCGGCLSCATCHVYVEGLPVEGQLPDASIDESELLEGSDYREHNSRLSCQIPFDQALDGIVVRIAPEE
ncbi:2Fe-2S iron-sulfur cluster-binding protein [Rhizobium sp. LEGMi198b]|uniref:2Fe-2S iron-sulfur cluster-binding protein n=1 Tax=unclassified Rhizobium TaxID=2613769 RepID=UPI0021A726FD|nr:MULTISPECIES: 2Fe-2S iron-sulfur cluster-binding protein [Rhizobium]MDK4743111.1 2Fe-2S iron-sulfur cluster-binding protein [Rhizobium sp. CNPSo 3464]UWU23838.1 2Fe-2S iron-sulfur cluster-binding protein [Rhizobium tropici]WFU04769.1 2Fe-2S iron-sulfur cluster-binding protein [Rhizobium sp. CB3171]